MQKRSKSVSDVKVPGWWLTIFPVDHSGLSLRTNWSLINPRAVHSSSRFLAKDIIRNRNNTRAMLYPCLTPNLKSIYVSILPMTILTIFFCTCVWFMSIVFVGSHISRLWLWVVHGWRCKRPWLGLQIPPILEDCGSVLDVKLFLLYMCHIDMECIEWDYRSAVFMWWWKFIIKLEEVTIEKN